MMIYLNGGPYGVQAGDTWSGGFLIGSASRSGNNGAMEHLFHRLLI